MIRTKFLKAVVIGLLLIAVSGCATRYGVASFKSEPDGVQIFDMEDGSVIGVTPVDYLWRSEDAKRKFMNVRMHKEGYQDVVKSFWLMLDHSSAGKAKSSPQLIQFEMIQE